MEEEQWGTTFELICIWECFLGAFLSPRAKESKEYNLKFTQLSYYALEMVANMRSWISFFMSGLSQL
ncbi:hypothetical protein H5410_003333 [Solanum commersonii]|uniref:Uncharacterized protein n=1 Tax=Solanum commersonii TaxID=4109 RepID=A0A9J6B4Q5_SOLCO|nr:hypothetical protein H5410_003333 [Solanum commersonii]